MGPIQKQEFMPLITISQYHTRKDPPLPLVNLNQNINSLPREHFFAVFRTKILINQSGCISSVAGMRMPGIHGAINCH